jgi:hypothetical protein
LHAAAMTTLKGQGIFSAASAFFPSKRKGLPTVIAAVAVKKISRKGKRLRNLPRISKSKCKQLFFNQ